MNGIKSLIISSGLSLLLGVLIFLISPLSHMRYYELDDIINMIDIVDTILSILLTLSLIITYYYLIKLAVMGLKAKFKKQKVASVDNSMLK